MDKVLDQKARSSSNNHANELYSDNDDADSAVWSEASMPRGIDLSGTQPRKKRMERTATCSEQSITAGPGFNDEDDDESLIHQLEVCKLCDRACGVCLGNVHNAVKHCKTCRVSYCETHVVDHYKSPAFSSHELVDYKQTSRESPSRDGSLQRSSDPVVLPELRVMMLGKTGSGKSASANTILGRKAFKSEASALPVTKSCDSQSGVVEGRNITVIDTPAIRTGKAAWLLEKVDPRPHVFLLVIPLGRFTEDDKKEVKWIKRNFGEEALKFTIILFTGDQMDEINAEQFLNESPGIQTLVSSTGGGYHIFDNKTPKGREQVKGLLEKIELLLRKNMGYSYSYGLHEQVTTAVREEEERKRREEEERRKGREEEKERERREENEERKRLSQEQRQNMEKRIEQKIMEQMELKMISLIANATATLNELREVVKATTEQIGNCLHEQVKTAVREEEERMIREEEEKEEKWERLEMEG